MIGQDHGIQQELHYLQRLAKWLIFMRMRL